MQKKSLAFAGALALYLTTAPLALARPLSEEEGAALRDQVGQLTEEITLLRARLDQFEKQQQAEKNAEALAQASTPTPAPAQATTSAPTGSASAPAASGPRIEWKGSPRIVEEDRSFKVKGRIQADANYIGALDGLDDKGLGFSSEFRRIRLGGEGQLGNGFGYKLELELSDNSVDLVDTFVTYKKGGWLLTLGNHNQFQSLDELIGDTTGSVMERAAFTDAFNFERRLGFSAQYETGPVLLQGGIFTDDVGALANDSDGPSGGDENNSFSLDGRAVFAPKIGDAQLHFAGSAHWRKLNRIAEDPVRYRQRPFFHSTNTRLIGTSELNVDEELSYGLEFAAVKGRWHAAAETHWLRASRIDASDPRFWGGYAEVGYYLTGESRPYGNGIFNTARPAKPLGDGGIGALQLNVRYDYLDLNSGDVRGGTQNGYIAALIWTPIQNLRFNFNYAYLDYSGAKPLDDGRTSYGIHAFGSRFELDF